MARPLSLSMPVCMGIARVITLLFLVILMLSDRIRFLFDNKWSDRSGSAKKVSSNGYNSLPRVANVDWLNNTAFFTITHQKFLRLGFQELGVPFSKFSFVPSHIYVLTQSHVVPQLKIHRLLWKRCIQEKQRQHILPHRHYYLQLCVRLWGVFFLCGNVPSVTLTFFKRNPWQSCILAYIADA